MAIYSVINLADTMEQVSALRNMKLELHERAARHRMDSGGYAVPAVITDEQIADEAGAAPFRLHDHQIKQKESAIMMLTTTTFISIDGVMQGIGAPDKHRRGGSGHGGWTQAIHSKGALRKTRS